MDDETLKVYGYVISSSYRERSVKNHISKVLKELKECGVAECINEEKRKNRIYKLTPKGEDIAKLID